MEEEEKDEYEDYAPPSLLPKRYLIVGLLFLVISQDLITRDLVRQTADLVLEQTSTNKTSKNPNCAHLAQARKRKKYQDIRKINYGWNNEIKDAIRIPFNIGYALGMPFWGYIADKYVCGKQLIDIFLSFSSLLCLSTPFIIHTTNGNMLVIRTMRIVLGVFSGISPTGFASIIAHWVPARRRTLLSSVALSGIAAGTVVKSYFAKQIAMVHSNYAIPYYVFGGTGIVIFVLWFTLASSSPEACLTISAQEKIYLDSQFGDTVDHGKKRVPLIRMLLSSDFLFLIFVSMSHIFVYNLLLNFAPSYFKRILRLDESKTAFWSTVPIVLMGITACAGGAFSDWALQQGNVNLTVMRKMYTNLGTLGATIYFMVGSLAGCEPNLVIVLFVIGVTLQGFNFAGIKIVIFDTSPNYAASLMGVTTGLGTATMLFVPLMLKNVAPKRTLLEYRNLFWILLGVSFFTNLIFVLFAQIRIVKWNTPPAAKRKENKSNRTVS